MFFDIEELGKQLLQTTKRPPVSQWHPTQQGVIDINIDNNMQWFHEGKAFERHALVKLFASILRYENNRYFLVTPVEKLAISVADVPFKISIMLSKNDAIYLVTNTEDAICLNASTNWQLRLYQNTLIPYVEVRDNLFARVDRGVFYQMVEQAELIDNKYVFKSGKCSFPLE